MKHHSELLNYIARKINAKTYVEIGVFNPDHNFNLIEVENKIGVDPDSNAKADCRMTSDQFFKFFGAINGKVDLTWIDGLHHEDQVQRDIEGAWDITHPGGVIAIHDCNPHSERITHVPRDNGEWTGNVYKAICRLVYPASYFTLNFDYGCCVIRKEEAFQLMRFNDMKVTWDEFNAHRETMINLISLEEGLARIDAWT